MVEFVNPYTFVPHVPEPVRAEPYGHERMGDGRFSGVLKVTVTAKTPLVIGGYAKGSPDEPDVPRRKSPRGRVMIPGSGFMGATRSVHEALTGSCLRVLDADFVPVHRHPAHVSQTAEMRFAVVREVDPATGRPCSVVLCHETERIEAAQLPRNGGVLPRTGDQLGFDRETETWRRLSGMGPVNRDCWVLLVTSTQARMEDPLRFHAGFAGPDSRRYEVSAGTWEKFKKVVNGADDLRRASLLAREHADGKEPPWGSTKAEYDPVDWRYGSREFVAERLLARTYFYEGQPVWVRVEEGKVTEIRLSLLWRYQGSGTVGERAKDAKPCTGPELCWSCRMFGSADTGGRGAGDLAVQRGYRGHIRVDDLLAVTPFEPVTWHLAPLVSPHPNAGQFYLDNSRVPDTHKLSPMNTKPAATWGSDADKLRDRPIRGRKFYWRTEADPTREQMPRGRKRREQADAVSRKAALIPAGATFEGRVYFDNLSLEEYGSLLAALNPRLLAKADDPDWEKTVTTVGGAKPFGLGSARVDIAVEKSQTARERYLGEPGVPPEMDEAIRAFRVAVPSKARGEWMRLRHALTFGYVNDELVWYPPGGETKGTEQFDYSFEFFARTNGVKTQREDRKMRELPDPAKPPEAQVLDSPVRDGRD